MTEEVGSSICWNNKGKKRHLIITTIAQTNPKTLSS